MRIVRTDPEHLTANSRRGRRELTPREREARAFALMVQQITGPEIVFHVVPEPDEIPSTVRGRILRAGRELSIDLAVRTDGERGWYVGILTDSRRSTRGRRRARDVAA